MVDFHRVHLVFNQPRLGVFAFVLFLSMIIFVYRRHDMQWFEVQWLEDELFNPDSDETQPSGSYDQHDGSSSSTSANTESDPPDISSDNIKNDSDSIDSEDSSNTNKILHSNNEKKHTLPKSTPSFTRHYSLSLLPIYNYVVQLDPFFSSSFGNFIFLNMCFALTLGIGFPIERIFFGSLRGNERRLVVEKSMTFIFYHILFLFGVVSLTIFEDILFWCFWFLIFAFLQHFTLLSVERLKFMVTGQYFNATGGGGGGGNHSHSQHSNNHSNFTSSSRPLENVSPYLRLTLLLLILLSLLISFIVFTVFFPSSTNLPWNVKSFLGTYLLYLATLNLHSLIKLALHIKKGTTSSNLFTEDLRLYYIYFGLDLLTLGVNMLHYALMIVWTQQFITLAGLVVLLHLRHIYFEIMMRFRRHKSLVQLKQRIHDCFPLVKRSLDGINAAVGNDNNCVQDDDSSHCTCAICWDELATSRRLPCKHEFHEVCLISWLLQDLTCPVCRRSLLPELRQIPLRDNNHHHPIVVNAASAAAAGGSGAASVGAGDGVDGATAALPSLNVVNSSTTNTRITIGVGLSASDANAAAASSTNNSTSSNQHGLPTNDMLPSTSSATTSNQLAHQNSTTYRFDGSRFCRWLPSFTVEIARFNAGSFLPPQAHVNNSGDLLHPSGFIESPFVSGDLQQLQDMFPHISRQRLQQELWNHSGSIEDVIDNILENSLDFNGSAEEDEEVADDADTLVSSILSNNNTQQLDASAGDLTTSFPSEGQSQQQANAVDSSTTTIYECASLSSFKADDFSPESKDREASFKSRREAMLSAARQRYIQQQQQQREKSSSAGCQINSN